MIFSKHIINIPGWRTKRKIVIIESDDWGSIRMPSKEVFLRFFKRGLDLSETDYNRFDSLESNDDLTMLYQVLYNHKDSKGNYPVITANCVVGNPDFQRIRESDFAQYFFEPFTETLKRYPNHDKVIPLYNEGLARRIFFPQFHGREHVNIVRWMNALRNGTSDILFCFDNETTFSGNGDYNFMEVLDYNTPTDLEGMNTSLIQGLELFEEIFGFRSRSFIPPCYTWDSEIEETLFNKGIRYLQGLVVQYVPTGSFGNYKKKYHFLGDRSRFGQTYLIRNAFFEPSLSNSNDPVGECLNRIGIAFKWHKPAIITSHRINYIGSLVEKNRSDNLKLLNELLMKILQKWPDVEFMTSDQLGDIITENQKKD